MSDRSPGEFARDCLAEAKKKGIADPVVLVLSERSEPARAIYADLHGRPMAPYDKETDHEFGPFEILPTAAADLLRRDADLGGGHVADLLQDVVLRERVRPDFWLVLVMQAEIHARAFLDGQVVWRTVTGYYRVRRDRQTPEQLAADDGPSLWRVRLEGDQLVPVCGPTGKEVIMAAALAEIATDRVIEARHEGRLVQLEIDDDRLASLLLEVYGDKPHAIAEAIMALRKAGGDKEGFLTNVLRATPSCRSSPRRCSASSRRSNPR
jgi:hypothetical protein